jgi:hypothetical protein
MKHSLPIALVFGLALIGSGCSSGGSGGGGAETARAYGHVSAAGALMQSKNVSDVTPHSPGTYCIALAADIDTAKTGVATPEMRSGGPSARRSSNGAPIQSSVQQTS